MNSDNESPADRKARLARFHAMTDEENDANIASDPDAQVPIEALRRAEGVLQPLIYPDGEAVVPLMLDAKTVRFLHEHHVDYQLFLAGVLRAYVESQQRPI